MNARNLIQASVIAALFAAGAAAQAAPVGDGDSQSSQAVQVHSTRSFAQARAESFASVGGVSHVQYDEIHGMVVEPVSGSGHLDRATVRAAARHAAPMGELGETNPLNF